jgi:hypothetical protein
MTQGVALCAFAVWLGARSRAAFRLMLAATALSLAAAAALQLRGLLAFGVIAAFALYATRRRIGRRSVVALVFASVLGVLLLGIVQQARQYSAQVAAPKAFRLAVETPLPDIFLSDLSTFDNFAAIQELVPGSVHYLDGASLLEIPAALVPRAVWPSKPLGLDHRVGTYLYPGGTPAGVPIGLQGELYWNGGLPVVAFGALLLGGLMGALARFGLTVHPESRAFLFYAVALPFTHALLTRGLATMTENLIFAIVGVGIALAATLRRAPA